MGEITILSLHLLGIFVSCCVNPKETSQVDKDLWTNRTLSHQL